VRFRVNDHQETERQREREKGRATEASRDRETERGTDRGGQRQRQTIMEREVCSMEPAYTSTIAR